MNSHQAPMVIDPTKREAVRATLVAFMRSRAPFTSAALKVVSGMAADVVVGSEQAGQSGWSRSRFEHEMDVYWLSIGINAKQHIDPSGHGSTHSLHALAFEVALTLAAESPAVAEA